MLRDLLSLFSSGMHQHFFMIFMDTKQFLYSDSIHESFHLPKSSYDWTDWYSIIHQDDQPSFQLIHQSFYQKRPDSFTLRCYQRNGKVIPLRFDFHYALIDQRPVCAGLIESVYDRHFDNFTGLPDALLCAQQCNEYIDKPEVDQFLLCLLDYGDKPEFSDLNSELQMCCKNADIIQLVLPKRARLFHLGSSLFAILAVNCSPQTLTAWLHAINIQLTIHDLPTLGGGYVSYPDHGMDWERLYKRAHFALKQALQDHSRILCSFVLPLEIQHTQARLLKQDLIQAIENDYQDFHLVYQPQVNKVGETKGFEALLRWAHTSIETVIDILESTDMMSQISAWLFHQALHDFVILRANRPELTLSINISYQQLLQPDLLNILEQSRKMFHLPAKVIILEITETCIAKNFTETKPLLEKMRKLGYQIALDDFGTGYSSLSFLRQMPIDEIKIDQSFVSELESHPQDITFIQLIYEIGKECQSKICIEGVETKQQLMMLDNIAYDCIQGYYYSRPLSIQDAQRYLHQPLKKNGQ